jgi:hypothetical protein
VSTATFSVGDAPFLLFPTDNQAMRVLLEDAWAPTLLRVTAELSERQSQGTLTLTPMEVRDWRQVDGCLWLPRTQLRRLGAALNSRNWLPQHHYLASATIVVVTFTLETL